MKNLLRFLVFVAIAAGAVGVLSLWKSTRPVTLLAQIDKESTELVGKVLPSVVSINTIPANETNPRGAFLSQLLGVGADSHPPTQLGAGAIVSREGFIVTNWHVIQNAGAVEVHLNDGRAFPAKFVGADKISDVAVLKIDAGDLPFLAFGDSDRARIGQTVIAVGNPFGLQESVTKGIISGKGRRMMSEAAYEFFQTDASSNPGNSGGPLVDIEGKILALNNSMIQNIEGISFAIPANTVRRIFENIRDYGRVIRPWFGVIMHPYPIYPAIASALNLPEARGAIVLETMGNSPARRSGIMPGDVILSYNGQPITDWIDLRNRVTGTEPGREISIGLIREGKPTELKVKIDRQPGE